MKSTINRLKRMYSLIFVLALSLSQTLLAADASPRVTLDVTKASPRTVENLTERAIARDYKFAWTSLSLALEGNDTAPLNGLFAGSADTWFRQLVTSQRQNGVTSRYLNQSHKVEASFYAPEGDVIELHDTAEYDLQILDGSRTVHNEHTVVHYVVLMTPAADRWVVRQIQAVP